MPDLSKMHLDPSVNLGHLLTTLTLIITAIIGFNKLSTRVSVLENRFVDFNSMYLSVMEAQRRTDSQQDADLQLFRREIRQEIQTIQQKLDSQSSKIDQQSGKLDSVLRAISGNGNDS